MKNPMPCFLVENCALLVLISTIQRSIEVIKWNKIYTSIRCCERLGTNNTSISVDIFEQRVPWAAWAERSIFIGRRQDPRPEILFLKQISNFLPIAHIFERFFLRSIFLGTNDIFEREHHIFEANNSIFNNKYHFRMKKSNLKADTQFYCEKL